MKKRFLKALFIILSVFVFIACADPVVQGDRLSIHFLELGNRYTGDSVYINYGDIDILIDAGSKHDSAPVIMAYIDRYMQDQKLEFVIATHAHEDHIAGFYSNYWIPGIFDVYDIGIIIDFPKTHKTIPVPPVTTVYGNYVISRADAVAKGAVHYTALQCYREEDGAQRVYNLGGGVFLEILYNYYYENETPDVNDENDYSVCIRIDDNGRQYLFTGDLEQIGEDKLVAYYQANHGGLGYCTLYKGGHHGSRTSSHEALMAAITPEYVIVCSCVGSSEYGARPENTFPSQDFINRIAPYTSNVYLTTLVSNYYDNQYSSFNGNIIFSVLNNGQISVRGSNNSIKLKDTAWFRDNRTMPPEWL